MLVLGAGPGGYSAAFRAADLGMKTVLVERYATLGGVCLNVGCIPSKALLHVAAVMDEVKHFSSMGVSYAEPSVDLAKLRTHKEKVVGKLTGGLTAMAKMRKVTVVQGNGEFVDPNRLAVALGKGGTQTIRFKQAIIAAASEAVKLPFLPKDDPRIVTSTGALELRQRPKRMLVIGGGIIGLEMGTVYSTLGARLDVVEMLDGLMQGADRDLVKVWQKMNAPRFDNIMLKTKTVGGEATADGIRIRFEGEGAPKEPQALRPRAAGGRPGAERQAHRRRQGRRRGRRARLHPGRHPDADQRAPHLRDRRHRRPADARAQGDARGPRRRRGRGRRAVRRREAEAHRVQRPRDPERRLHRSGDRVGRRHRGRGEGERHEGQEGPVPVERVGPGDRERARRGLHEAAVQRGDPRDRRRRHRRHPCRAT
jgi:thioredoxin reductase